MRTTRLGLAATVEQDRRQPECEPGQTLAVSKKWRFHAAATRPNRSVVIAGFNRRICSFLLRAHTFL
jgi:hypothetical protein